MRRRLAATVVTLSLLLFAVPTLAADSYVRDPAGTPVMEDALGAGATIGFTVENVECGSGTDWGGAEQTHFRFVVYDNAYASTYGTIFECGAGPFDDSIVLPVDGYRVVTLQGCPDDTCTSSTNELQTGALEGDTEDLFVVTDFVEDTVWTLNDPVDASDHAAMVGLGLAPALFFAAAYWPRKG